MIKPLKTSLALFGIATIILLCSFLNPLTMGETVKECGLYGPVKTITEVKYNTKNEKLHDIEVAFNERGQLTTLKEFNYDPKYDHDDESYIVLDYQEIYAYDENNMLKSVKSNTEYHWPEMWQTGIFEEEYKGGKVISSSGNKKTLYIRKNGTKEIGEQLIYESRNEYNVHEELTGFYERHYEYVEDEAYENVLMEFYESEKLVRAVHYDYHEQDGKVLKADTTEFDYSDDPISEEYDKAAYEEDDEAMMMDMENIVNFEKDEQGNYIMKEIMPENGKKTMMYTFQYTYDDKGNWIKRSTQTDGKETSTSERTIVYY